MLQWDGRSLTVGDTTFLSGYWLRERSDASRFVIHKGREQIEALAAIVADLAPTRIVDLGIAEGGSCALLASLTDAQKLVAVDLRDLHLPLEEWIEQHGLSDRVKTFYGVDQADAALLRSICETEFDGPLDLVIDDASHQVAETRASFDVLFPRLRPGGLFLIEDWQWGHVPAAEIGAGPKAEMLRAALPGGAPLTVLLLELMMAMATDPTVIERIDIDHDVARVHRGPAELGDDFSLATSFEPGGVEVSYTAPS
jgi:predicted O-methyltransferase YrrM